MSRQIRHIAIMILLAVAAGSVSGQEVTEPGRVLPDKRQDRGRQLRHEDSRMARLYSLRFPKEPRRKPGRCYEYGLLRHIQQPDYGGFHPERHYELSLSLKLNILQRFVS